MDSAQSCLPCRRRINHPHEERGRQGARPVHRLLHSSRPTGSRLRAGEHRPRSKGGGLCHPGRSQDRESRRIQLHSDRGQLRSASGKTRYGLYDRQYIDLCFHRSGHPENVCAGGPEPPQINAAHRRSNRRCRFRLCRCLAPIVKRVLLSARNVERLSRLAAELQDEGVQVEVATDLQQFSAEADVVICAASLASPSLLLGRIAPDAIVCDAGYPKNLSPTAEMLDAKVFFGGLGQIIGGMKFTPDFHGILNRHPFPDVVHGCLLEGMALALEHRFEPFSQGRGFITQERVAEIETIAARHGIYLAPLYNADGPLEDRLDARWNGREDESMGERPSRTVESSF